MVYDFIVVGGGILGHSVAMQLLDKYPDSQIALLEKEKTSAMHQTGHNSGVIHAGVYYTPGTLKAHFCYEGNKATKDFCNENGIKYDECGKLLVATNELEMQRMEELWERTKENKLERYRLNATELKEKEKNIVGLGGIFFPTSGIVSYTEVTKAMAQRFVANGGAIYYNNEVLCLNEQTHDVKVTTQESNFIGKFLITCCGLQSDKIVKMLGINPKFIICPFRGEYYQLNAKHNDIVKHLIYPIPDPSVPFLGVHLTRMIDGSVTVGPNAVLALKREGYTKKDFSLLDVKEMLFHKGIRKVIAKNFKTGLIEFKNSFSKSSYLRLVQKYCPSLKLDDLTFYPAGVRAQAVSDSGDLIEDFLFVNTQRTVNVCNAPSPAATSALPIGVHIIEQLETILKH
ncbi:L-2-hydroxyglutarate oxidase [Campylobacter sp. MIT 21-1685]|uniref:L-2-hydroxyglutarate oxidase n=1 Tax=unclassified Campylobacter TaxID=2593542 RepID=UPI00224B9612|nr:MULTISPECIES: L-2-hydroxyglutarate oxidase [unclassified Campylobacter]MCX2682258.1 L-2-hydroxyglutarate oxidase [Campylobacter sp. MIT 21-1684]MCX2750539.1 L-2-hydroxyglutarate oxidase [Campylobacter sp. MIT 21-1682]MCX2806913.1 L-2-hydroxyglutarate oxidase [Campylobacter sp. MIT 21-1685]